VVMMAQSHYLNGYLSCTAAQGASASLRAEQMV